MVSKKCRSSLKLPNLREITIGLCVLGLLLIEKSGESDDLCVDLLVADSAALSVSRHICGFANSLRVVKACRGLAWKR